LPAVTLAALAGFNLGLVSLIITMGSIALTPFARYTSWWWVFLLWALANGATVGATSIWIGRRSGIPVLAIGSPMFGGLAGFFVFWSVFLLFLWEPSD